MSQEKSQEEKKKLFKEELRNIVSEELDKRTKTEKPSKVGHETVEDMMNCPNCRPKAEAIVIEKLKDTKGECAECGFPILDVEKTEKCPRCGSTEGKLRE